MPTIRLDADVYDALKKLAEPFTDTPNSVIRRLLEDKDLLTRKLEKKQVPAAKTDPDLEPTPQAVYEEFLLRILDEQFKGRGDKRSVTLAIIEKMQKLRR